MSGRPTIRDVAKRAGVSVSTVSRVLNDYPFVDDATRARVQDASAALGYEPDVAARSMRTGASLAIGLVVDDFTNPVFSAIAMGADAVLHEHGYSLVIGASQRDVEREAEVIAALRQRRVDALLVSIADEEAEGLQELLAGFRAVVLLDRELRAVACDAVWPDHAAGMRQALDYLLELNHERIALIAGPQNQRGSRARVEAYRTHLGAKGVAVDDALLLVADMSRKAGYHATCQLLDDVDPPTAIILGSNQLFAGAISAIRDRDVQMPAELCLVTTDEVDASQLHRPSIDVIGRDLAEMGRAAAELAVQRLGNRAAPPRHRVTPTEFVARSNSTPPRPLRVRGVA